MIGPIAIGDSVAVLDHGYVQLIEPWGTGLGGRALLADGTLVPADYEVGIIEAARQSTQGTFRGWETDSRLLATLATKRHDSPFEFAGMVLEIQAPIATFREWHRHRTQSYNEASARYAPLPPLDYLPTYERVMMGAAATTNRQAQGVGGAELTGEAANAGLVMLEQHYRMSEQVYQWLLSAGWQKELARNALTVGRYSRMRVHANLRNWLAFLTLRMDPDAQWEIRQYANLVGEIIRQHYPQTWRLFAKRTGLEVQS
jgi:thymidylate synthase (FAD)